MPSHTWQHINYSPPSTCRLHASPEERALHDYVQAATDAIAKRVAAQWLAFEEAQRVDRRAQVQALWETFVADQPLPPRQVPPGMLACQMWGVTDEDRLLIRTARDLLRWQTYRCAICARYADPIQLDHDHGTGLIRGWLCERCNSAEGRRGAEGALVLYRTVNPAALLGFRVPYSFGSQNPDRPHVGARRRVA